jgi:hypothetical protein
MYINIHLIKTQRGSVLGWGTMPQAGRSRIPDEVVGFLNWLKPHCGPGVDSASNRNEYQESSWGGGGGGKRRSAREADLTAICEPIV